MSNGKVTVGYGTTQQREINVIDYIQVEFKDHRLISISTLEDGSVVSSVENPTSTGRGPQSTIWLSRESFIGLLASAHLYFLAKDQDIEDELKNAITGDVINYNITDNLKPI